MTEPLTPEEERSLRNAIARGEPLRLFAVSRGIRHVVTRLLATLDAARQPAPEAARADWSVAPGEVLREWFTERGITQSKVAARMGVSPPEVSKLVNGHDRITPRMALALERACGINADVLARMQTDHDLRALRAATPEDPR